MENENTNVGNKSAEAVVETTSSLEPNSGGAGAIIGAIIIIVIIIAGGWYFIGNRVEKMNNQEEVTEVADIATGTSTEIADIQADLDALDLDALDEEL